MANDKTYDRHINIWINGKEVTNDVASIKKEMLKLTNETARATLGTQEYNEKAAELRKIKGILKEHQDNIAATGSSWTKLKGLFSSAQGIFLAGLGAITAGYQSLKGVITSTDALSDKFEKTLGGWKGGIDALARSLATISSGGLKDLGKKIREGINEGRRYAESLDQIDERTRALMISEAEAANELLRQREIQNDVRKSLTERNEAGKQAIKIEENLAVIRTSIAEQGYKNEAKNIATITGLTEEEVLAYARQEEQITANIEAGRKYNQNIIDRDKLMVKSLQGIQLTDAESARYKLLQEQISTASEEIKSFAFAAANMPGDEKMQLFVDKYVAYQQAIGSARENTLRIRTKAANIEKQLDKEGAELYDVVAKAPDIKYNPEDFIKSEEYQRAIQEKKLNEESLKDTEETEQKRIEAIKKAGEEGTEAAKIEWADRKAKEKADMDEMISEYVNYAGNVGEILGQAIVEGDNFLKAAAKQMLLFAIDILAKKAKIYEADMLMSSIAAYGPIVGTIRAMAATLLIETALSAARAVINKKMFAGGYTGPGGKYEPAGIVHKGEWVANQEMVASPVTGPIIQALEQRRVSGPGSFADGGFTSPGSSPAGGSGSGIGTDPRMDNALDRIYNVLDRLDRNGVTTRWSYRDVDNVRKGMDRLDEIEGDVTR